MYSLVCPPARSPLAGENTFMREPLAWEAFSQARACRERDAGSKKAEEQPAGGVLRVDVACLAADISPSTPPTRPLPPADGRHISGLLQPPRPPQRRVLWQVRLCGAAGRGHPAGVPPLLCLPCCCSWAHSCQLPRGHSAVREHQCLAEPAAQRWGYSLEPRVGPLWKSESGELSNLRWDIKPSDVPFYFKQASAAAGRSGRLARGRSKERLGLQQHRPAGRQPCCAVTGAQAALPCHPLTPRWPPCPAAVHPQGRQRQRGAGAGGLCARPGGRCPCAAQQVPL